MNILTDLLDRYAAPDGLSVDAREWLLFLELDPTRAADVLRHLSILAAEDTAIAVATAAIDALHAGSARRDAYTHTGTGESDNAIAELSAFTRRVDTARAGAAAVWTDHLQPLLVQACVLSPAPPACRPPGRWISGTVWLSGLDSRYPARVAARRRRGGQPINRLHLATCARIADDLATATGWQPARPVIVMDTDRPALVLGAPDLDTAWARDALVAVPDRDGWVNLGGGWPWHTNTVSIARSAWRRYRPTGAGRPLPSRRRRLSPRPAGHAMT